MAMDFFESQDAARKQSGMLVFYFVCAVLAIVVAVNAVVYATLFALEQQSVGQRYDGRTRMESSGIDPIAVGLITTAVTVAVIAGGSVMKTALLSSGGAPIAEALGGRRVLPSTRDRRERQLINVVEEMAIAAGCPVPAVYLLNDEDGINAFAAGNSPADAVIGVTKGCLRALTRDELQGVIAHEFSHILNGDMRLNLRLIGILHGILMLATIGYYLMRTAGYSGHSRNDRGGGQLVLIGLGVMILGYVGVVFGRLIKSAVSRQREYLADASAVQFTRNPEGIAGALMKIGGLSRGARIGSPEAEEASHLFFANAISSASGGMATHPPLSKRIRAILPDWDGKIPKFTLPDEDDDQPKDWDERQQRKRARREQKLAKLKKAPVVGAVVGDLTSAEGLTGGGDSPIALTPMLALAAVGAPGEQHVAYAEAFHDAVDDALVDEVHDPFGAVCAVYALLLDRDDEAVRARQLDYLAQNAPQGTRGEVQRIHPLVLELGPQGAIPLADMAMPALRDLTPEQYADFGGHVEALVMADDQVTLFEMALQKMIGRHLDQHFDPRPHKVRYPSVAGVAPELSILLSAASYLGGPDQATPAFEKAKSSLKLDRLQHLTPDKCSVGAVSEALDKLAEAHPMVKKRLLTALTEAISADEVVTIGEGELLRAVSDALDVPMPPLVGAPQEA